MYPMTDDGIWLQFATAALAGYTANPSLDQTDMSRRIGRIADAMLALWRERERVREPPQMTLAEIVAEATNGRR
jgi:hypothetical protein